MPISAEGLEVVPALQKMRGLFHGRNIKRFSQLPHIAPREYVLFTAGANAVTIEFSCRGETAVKTLSRYPHARHTDVIWQKTVQFILQLPDGQRHRKLNIRTLSARMDSGICPSCADDLRLFARQLPECLFQLALDRLFRACLPLPTFVAAAIIGNDK